MLPNEIKNLFEELQREATPLEASSPRGKFLIYGGSGVGKTVEALMLAQKITDSDEDIVYVDAVEGWVSANNHPSLKARVTRVPYRGLSQLEVLCMAISAKREPFDKVGCLILDEYSTMARRDVDIVLTARAAKDGTKDPDIATFTDSGISTRRMSRATDSILTLNTVHLILLAHVRMDKDKSNIEVKSPSFMPKFGGIIKEPMHVVAYMSSDQVTDGNGTPSYRRALQVHPTRKIDAKTRVGGMGVQVTPDQFNTAVLDWFKNGAPKVEVKEVEVNDVFESESEDFEGIVVE